MKYVMGIDQSTQRTKVLLFDAEGEIVARVDRPHRQIINVEGWVSHDMNEIWQNLLDAVKDLLSKCSLTGTEIACVGISNQRETTIAWNNQGTPLADAIVWQCGRAVQIAESHQVGEWMIRKTTGLALSPFYPAAKMEWMYKNLVAVRNAAEDGSLHLGTVESYLIYRMTGGGTFATDASNAGRYQLMDIHTVDWSDKLLQIFQLKREWLPNIVSSNADFGMTDFDGILPVRIPIRAAMGDSHSALYGHGCHETGMTKTTYGTGSSIMMNTAHQLVEDPALSTCIAYEIDGETTYCLEGNINYTGAVNTWLKDELHLIDTTKEINDLIAQANPDDMTIIIPAFTGLSAPYWDNQARASILYMSRTTGRAELVKAGNESIAMQITDVLETMEKAYGRHISEIRVDGGPTRNQYLMQYQSDMAGCQVCVPDHEELSAMGVAYLAGITAGIYEKDQLFQKHKYDTYVPKMKKQRRQALRGHWEKGMKVIIALGHETI